jgi:hypothetical protein
MPSIIFKIIKESAIILATLLLCNLVLNNNYVRPTLDILNSQKEVASDTSWHIYKREHKLLLGISGHHFIEMRDENNNIISQIHGKAYDPTDKEIVEVAKSMSKNYKLKVIEYNGDKYSDKNINIGDIGIEVASDDKDTIINNWNKARECGKVINSKNIDYPKFGFKLVSETENSNSVAHTLIQCMGYKDENIGLFNPGEKSLLINVN